MLCGDFFCMMLVLESIRGDISVQTARDMFGTEFIQLVRPILILRPPLIDHPRQVAKKLSNSRPQMLYALRGKRAFEVIKYPST